MQPLSGKLKIDVWNWWLSKIVRRGNIPIFKNKDINLKELFPDVLIKKSIDRETGSKSVTPSTRPCFYICSEHSMAVGYIITCVFMDTVCSFNA